MRTNIFFTTMYSIVALLAVSCDKRHNEHSVETHSDQHTDEIIFTHKQAADADMKTETIALCDFINVLKVGGQIETTASDEQTIAATSSGIITFTNACITEGSPVKAGQSIVTISSKQLQDGDPTLKAKAEYEAAESAFRRAESLVAERIIATKEFEQIRLRYETAKATYQGLSSNITNGGVNVVSPINGYIKNRLVKQGDHVSVGTPIATITQIRRLQLRAEVPEKYFKQLHNVSSANFKPAYDDTVYRLSDLGGRLLSYSRSTTTGSPYLPVTFEFNNVGNFLPGSFVEVFLLLQPKKDVISLPIRAITEEQGIYYVYVQVKGEEEVFIKREVTLGMNNGERVEITKGLSAGDIVVTQGAYQVKLAASSTSVPEGHSH